MRIERWRGRCAVAACLAASALAPCAGAQDAEPGAAAAAAVAAVAASDAETVVVTATRSAEPAFAVPAAISVVDTEELHGNALGTSVVEALPRVPGLLARDRQNFAQDAQISIRGFGARSTFGVSGLRLYVDGIPATQPDGQGQVSHFNLASAQRIEVLRGPFSALYGNSSGGVVQLFTADGRAPGQLSAGVAAGSFGALRSSAGASGRSGSAAYTLDYTHFQTDGFREHSQARRESFNAKLDFDGIAQGRLTLLLNAFDAPDAQDPLGLSRAQFEERPQQAAPVATQFDTRKSADQTQFGAIYERPLGAAQSLRLLAYYGRRNVEQFLAIPVAPQGNPRHAGGVVDLGSDYGGADARWSWRGRLAAQPLRVVAGLSYDDLAQQRRGYENFVGDTLGVRGALRRDEDNQVYDFDQYLQADWAFMPRGSLLAGLRHSQLRFESRDHFITAANPDDSGAKRYRATTPVAALSLRPDADLHLYGAYGEGFETPTIAELAYRPDARAGLNFDLDAAGSRNAELGAKWRLRPRLQAELALFQTGTRDELVIATNGGGRSTYANAGRTRRRGVEAAAEARPWRRVQLQLAYTLLDARLRESYETCIGTPCTLPSADNPSGSNRGTIAAGKRIAGVPESNVYARLGWGDERGLALELDGRYLSRVPVNDANSEAAPACGLLGAGASYVFELPRWRLRSFVRIDNLLDKKYVGSVIVNDGNGRYYEPGPERSFVAGLELRWKRR